MRIETLEIAGFRAAMLALRLPYNKEPRSETGYADCQVRKSLDDVGADPAIVNVHEIWDFGTHVEFNRDDIELLSRLVRTGDEHAKVCRGIVVWTRITAPLYWWIDLETYRAGHERLMSQSTMNTECKGLHGEELQRVKGEIPLSREITKIDYFSYQTLRRICLQRHNHRLPEFHQFIDWVKGLPLANDLILPEEKILPDGSPSIEES